MTRWYDLPTLLPECRFVLTVKRLYHASLPYHSQVPAHASCVIMCRASIPPTPGSTPALRSLGMSRLTEYTAHQRPQHSAPRLPAATYPTSALIPYTPHLPSTKSPAQAKPNPSGHSPSPPPLPHTRPARSRPSAATSRPSSATHPPA